MKTFYKFLAPCPETVAQISDGLAKQEIRVKSSFALRTALPQAFPCACKAHETAVCQCEMMVLLVYLPSTTPPLSIILHSNGQDTWSTIEYPQSDTMLPHWAELQHFLIALCDDVIQQTETY